MMLIVLVKEGIAVTLEQRLVHMHAGTVDTENRFGHKGSIDPKFQSYLFDY